jgi:hypothetical protein
VVAGLPFKIIGDPDTEKDDTRFGDSLPTPVDALAPISATESVMPLLALLLFLFSFSFFSLSPSFSKSRWGRESLNVLFSDSNKLGCGLP